MKSTVHQGDLYRVLALFAGVGGLELGLHLATAGRTHVVGWVERDAHAAATLVARMAILGDAPLWDDAATFDARPYRGRVDLVSAGFECQPWSVAGKRRGKDDRRWTWPHVARIVGECAPAAAFFENVPGLRSGGLQPVLTDLAALGFNAEWTTLSARACGAPHGRDRLWILAYAGDHGRTLLRTALHDPRADAPRHLGHRCDPRVAPGLAHASGPGPEGPDGLAGGPRGRPARRGGGLVHGRAGPQERPRVAHPHRLPGREPTERHEREPAERGHADPGHPGAFLGVHPPRPGDADAWAAWIAAGGPEPGVSRGPDGPAVDLDRLRLIGGGAHPLVVAYAFRALAARALGFDGPGGLSPSVSLQGSAGIPASPCPWGQGGGSACGGNR